jgi:hypothetical protein
MASRNDITGKVIKTNPQNSAYAEGWERIFSKKTAYEWLEKMPNIKLLDPDGWRQNDNVILTTPITWADFQKRLSMSTVLGDIENE